MFDFEKAVAAWRHEMVAGGIESRELLDELEGHLREEFAQQRQSGLEAQRAFAAAVQRIGLPSALTAEFGKIGETKSTRRWRQLQILLVANLSVISLFMIACLVFKLGSFQEITPTEQASGLAAVAVMILLSSGGWLGRRFFPAIPNQRVRTAIVFAGSSLMFAWLILFYYLVLPRVEYTITQLCVAVLWAMMAPAGALAGVVYGLEAAAHRQRMESTG